MLKSKTCRRVAVKTAAIAAACGGIFFGAVPAIASMVATPKTVTYTCTASGTTATYKVQVDITGPQAPAPSSTVVATWAVQQPAASPFFTAASAIPATERLVLDGDALVTSSPSIVPSELRTVAATGAAASISAGASLQPLPMLITMTPTATGVIAVQPGSFSLYLEPGAGNGGDLYVCDVANTASAEASAAALLITVKPSGTTTGTGTPTPTPTPSNTTPTPTATPTTAAPVVTVTRTRTAKPAEDSQIDETPGGGASTGGGGDAGPDARVIMFSGALMVAGAAIGGLVLRRRTATRG